MLKIPPFFSGSVSISRQRPWSEVFGLREPAVLPDPPEMRAENYEQQDREEHDMKKIYPGERFLARGQTAQEQFLGKAADVEVLRYSEGSR